MSRAKYFGEELKMRALGLVPPSRVAKSLGEATITGQGFCVRRTASAVRLAATSDGSKTTRAGLERVKAVTMMMSRAAMPRQKQMKLRHTNLANGEQILNGKRLSNFGT
mmetsp:Transcript_10479/g.15700  ORF Transcript_10479/g.15700 Transcript_10479/m.15700 type:complete len:109 (+) Transcript_10479:822-1148(+)